jgi:Fic family protein
MPSRLTPFFPDHPDVAVMRTRALAVFDLDKNVRHTLLEQEKGILLERVLAKSVVASMAIEGEETTAGQIQDANPGSLSDIRARRLLSAHREFDPEPSSLYSVFSILNAHSLWCSPLTGDEGPLIDGYPGYFRTVDVLIGDGLAPSPDLIEPMIKRISEAQRWLHTPQDRLISLFALNHRFLVVHPFVDGNGRISRLLLEAGLKGLGFSGAWSLSEVLHRRQEEYFAHIRIAERPRQGDLDGRGNLSRAGLVAYLDFMLDCCFDAIDECLTA